MSHTLITASELAGRLVGLELRCKGQGQEVDPQEILAAANMLRRIQEQIFRDRGIQHESPQVVLDMLSVQDALQALGPAESRLSARAISQIATLNSFVMCLEAKYAQTPEAQKVPA